MMSLSKALYPGKIQCCRGHKVKPTVAAGAPSPEAPGKLTRKDPASTKPSSSAILGQKREGIIPFAGEKGVR